MVCYLIMNILFLQEQPCVRTLKYAQGLKKYDNNIRLFFGYHGKTLTQFYGAGNELFCEWIKLNNIPTEYMLPDIVDKLNIDLIHSHNAPDNLTVAAIHYLGNKVPIIHDIHDLNSIRKTPYDDGINRIKLKHQHLVAQERTAIEESSGIITVSQEIISIIRHKYDFDSQRYLVFPNFVSEDMIPISLKQKLSHKTGKIHIVYEGHLDNNSDGHYDLLSIFKEIAHHEIQIHIYASRENAIYKDLALRNKFIHYHGNLPLKILLSEITQYDFGWAGFNTRINKIHTNTVLPNKIFEYISAGLPVISFPHKAQKDFLEKNNLGIIIKDLKNLKKDLKTPKVKGIIKSAHQKRFSFTTRKNIERIYNFYKKILH